MQGQRQADGPGADNRDPPILVDHAHSLGQARIIRCAAAFDVRAVGIDAALARAARSTRAARASRHHW
jgi:hypothetical protein